MILKKNFDLAVVGKSYFHYIYALEALKEKKNILLLEDDRLNFGNLHHYGMCNLEVEYLKTIGVDLDIETLINLPQFLRKKSIYFILNNKRVLLGRSPLQNYEELARKLPQFFNLEDSILSAINDDAFNSEFYEFIKKLGADSYRFKIIQNVDLDFLIKDAPKLLVHLYEKLKHVVLLNSKEVRSFLYHTRSFYHKVLTSSHPDYEVFHLLICLLSEHYILDEKHLMSELENTVVSRGGSFKSTQIKDWKFFNSKPWCIELSSFEGIVHPEKMAFIGLDPEKLKLRTNNIGPVYKSVKFHLSLDEKKLKSLEKSIVKVGNVNDMATFFTSWQFHISTQGHVHGFCLIKKLEGNKESFIEEDFRAGLKNALSVWYTIDEGDDDFVSEFFMGEELYPDSSFAYKKPFLPQYRNVKLVDYSSPNSTLDLKNVAYYGPLKRQGFGLYGQLLELKEGSYFR